MLHHTYIRAIAEYGARHLLGNRVVSGTDTATLQHLLERAVTDLGESVARLHSAGLSHGDLTLGNVIRSDDRCYLIDPSMGEMNPTPEDMAVDLHALLQSLRSQGEDRLGDRFLESYRESGGVKEVLDRLEEIEKRGRYR